MKLLIAISVLALAVVAGVLLVRYRRMALGLRRMSTMMQHLSSYAFLINKDFEVKETNYYALNPDVEKKAPQILGNVLHCSVACHEGTCGQGLACKHCPVRFVISKAFERQHDFSDLEVSMELQHGASRQVSDVDVNVGGRYVSLSGEPYMVINVKDVSESRRLMRRYIDQHLLEETDPSVPKLLYATQDLARFNRMRELLSHTCRLVYAEKPEQVLHRVGKGKDFGYTAVMLDDAFVHAHDITDQINEHIVVFRLSGDDVSGISGRTITIPQSVSDEELKKIVERNFG